MISHRQNFVIMAISLLASCAETVPSERPLDDPFLADDAQVSTSDLSSNDGSSNPNGSVHVDGACRSSKWILRNQRFQLQCQSSTLELKPQIRVNEQWHLPEDCSPDSANEYLCSFTRIGRLTLRFDGPLIAPKLIAAQGQAIGGFRLVGTLQTENATGWISNGLQSVSQSGIIKIPNSISNRERQSALTAQNDVEVIRSGRDNSWWYTAVFGDISFVAGSITAEHFRSWIAVTGLSPRYQVELSSGGNGEHRMVDDGTEIELETWFVSFSKDPVEALTEYGLQLPKRRSPILQPELGWNSWYEFWDDIDVEGIVENIERLSDLFRTLNTPNAVRRIVVDDGWQREWGIWSPNEQFSGGLESLAADIRQRGYQPGIWIAPLLVKATLPIAMNNPTWFVGGTSFRHLRHGEMRIIDITNPNAAAFVQTNIGRLVDAGFSLLKVDYLFAGAYKGRRQDDITGLRAYNLALEKIRNAAGPNTSIIAVGALPIAGFEHLDGWRFGPNVAVQLVGPSWYYITGIARSLSARWPFCLAILCDADPVLLRDLPANERMVGVWTNALAGGSFMLSDDLRQLNGQEFESVTNESMLAALSGQPAQPIEIPSTVPDILVSSLNDHGESRSRHQIPSRWLLPDGRIVMFNWSDEVLFQDGQRIPARSMYLGALADDNGP